MARPIKWKIGKFRTMKLKLYGETFERYQQIVKARKKTIQQDFEDYVNQTIN